MITERTDRAWRAAQLASLDAFAVTPDVVEIALAATWLSQCMRRSGMIEAARGGLLRLLRDRVKGGADPWIAAEAIWRAAEAARVAAGGGR